jgi:tetratricopeptide (TPR) repeat protein
MPLLAMAAEPYTYVHHPVSTDRPEAQAAFDRGLTMIYAYAPDEAELSFQLAAKLDPSLAMAWWGMALAEGPNINSEPELESTHRAAQALEQAAVLAATHATPEERAYIAALRTRYSSEAHPDFDALGIKYRDSMRALVEAYPEDADAGALYAEATMDLHPWRLWSDAGVPTPGTEDLVPSLEAHLVRAPLHIGLMHLYIHAVEASPHPEKALPVARRLGSLPMEPAAAHLVHMPAHIYLRVGDWAAAIEANEHSVHHALDYRHSAYPADAQACAHCLDFLRYAYAMAGNFMGARMAAEHYEALSKDPTDTLSVLVRFRQWEAILQRPTPGQASQPDHVNEHFLLGFWHFARGMALAGTGRIAEAGAELSELQNELAALPGRFAVGPGKLDLEHALDDLYREGDQETLSIAEAVLGARLAEAKGQSVAALAFWRTAVERQDRAAYSEPPLWYYPVRDSLGAALIRAGAARAAEAVFQEDLARQPNNPRAYFGLAAANRALHRRAAAQTAEASFQASWGLADQPLTLEEL